MVGADGRRRVLLVGVGKFGNDLACLDFAHDRVDSLRAAFDIYRDGGFEVTTLLDPDENAMDAAVNEIFLDEEVAARIVHVISHGKRSATQAHWLEVMSTGRCSGRNNAFSWVQRAQQQAAPTLFLIDLCHAGEVTDLAQRREWDDDECRAWVFAASRSYEKAFDGRLSAAAATILSECAHSGLGVESARQFVPLDVLARRIGDLLKGQHFTTTRVQLHQSTDLPFLPNRNWNPDPEVRALVRQINALDTSLRSFVEDEVFDHRHFQSRAGAHFTGRRAELERLVPWLDGAGENNLRVVTGTAGAGKSALLGALVCAAHPALARIAPEVGDRLPLRPRHNPLLVAIHARQRRLGEILESIAAQLGLTWPDERREAARLIDMIAAMPLPPVLILDALDECPDYEAAQAVLLIPLAAKRRAHGVPACRVLVGMRPWNTFQPLIDLSANGLVDLDEVDPRVLRHDLHAYLSSLLQGAPFAARIANRVATVLAQDFRQRRHLPPEQRQGQFLVASRYADYVRRHPSPEPEAKLRRVPTELPEVLELELSASDDPRPLRATLAALAFAKGEGMPEEVARAVAAGFGAEGKDVLAGEAARLYLRIGTDTDGTSLYRLYHQGLADYLRRYPRDPQVHEHPEPQVYHALIATRRDSAGKTWWHNAAPYLKRHAIHHAADASTVDDLIVDPEFLVHADPVTLLPELDHASRDDARMAAAIYRTSYHLYRDDPIWRRRLLLLNAARYRAQALTNGLKGGAPW